MLIWTKSFLTSGRGRIQKVFQSLLQAVTNPVPELEPNSATWNRILAYWEQPPVMKAELNLKIVPLTQEEMPMVATFFHKHFFSGEPMNMAIERHPLPEEIPFVGVLKEGLSFKAVNLLEKSEDNIVGVVVNAEASLGKKKQSNSTDAKGLKIRKILKELDERSKIWEVVNNENHFNVVAVAVDKKYYGHKIGQKLVEESLKLAKSLNYKYASIECSSFYSWKFAVEMGFELLVEIPYDEYLDENNEQVFKVSKPHTALRKLIKRL